MHAGVHRVRLLFASNCGACCLLWRTLAAKGEGSQRLGMHWTLLVMTQALCLGSVVRVCRCSRRHRRDSPSISSSPAQLHEDLCTSWLPHLAGVVVELADAVGEVDAEPVAEGLQVPLP